LIQKIKAAMLARIEAQHLLRNPEYRNAFEYVLFAVLDRKGQQLPPLKRSSLEKKLNEECNRAVRACSQSWATQNGSVLGASAIKEWFDHEDLLQPMVRSGVLYRWHTVPDSRTLHDGGKSPLVR
jgi:hypothetical protein